MTKPRLATVWLDGCSGCHMSFLDMDERLLEITALADIVYSPLIDVKEYPEDVDFCLVEGAVSSEDDLHKIALVRSRTKKLISFGDCAVTGNVTALRNLFALEHVLDRAYRENSDVVNGIPTGDGTVPRLLDRVLRVQDVVRVDHFLPGCPPSAGVIRAFLEQLLSGGPVVTAGRKFGE